LRLKMVEVIQIYSFTQDELEEPERNGLALNPTKTDDAVFDECVAEIYHRQSELRRQEQASLRG